MTKERPILFSGPMVRALLNGTKTQTRRVVKPTQSTPKVAPLHMEPYLVEMSDGTFEQDLDEHGLPMWIGTHPDYPSEHGKWFSCPHGQPGDRLWVRETYAVYGEFQDGTGYCYRADGDKSITWKPSIFMPRAACRIVLEITGVRVERLQDISEDDAQAEGVELLPCTYVGRCQSNSCPRHGRLDRYRLAYKGLWNDLNAKRGYGWDTNPWVWVLEFKAVPS